MDGREADSRRTRPGLHILQGAVMGTADAVPGVSGGTLALILGIYDRFIAALSSVGFRTMRALAGIGSSDGRGRLVAHLREADVPFLFWLGLGMAAALISVAHGVSWLLDNAPQVMMGLFLGLILASVRLPWRLIPSHGATTVVALLVGAAAAAILSLATPSGLPVTLPVLFAGGIAAVSVMLLPGVSGSSLLVLLGLYDAALAAVRDLQWSRIAAIGLGGIVGLAAASRMLGFLLARRPGPTLAAVTGLMVGSTVRLWPWRTEPGFAEGLPAVPEGGIALLVGAAAMAAGAALSLGLERLGANGQQPRAKTA